MVSSWFDESDFQKWIDENPDLRDEIEELKSKWIFEFDTIQNRKVMREEFTDLVKNYISKIRDEKIDSIIE